MSSLTSEGEQLSSDKKRLLDDQAYQEGSIISQQRQKISHQESIDAQALNQPVIVQTSVPQQPSRSTSLRRLPTQTVAQQVATANEIPSKFPASTGETSYDEEKDLETEIPSIHTPQSIQLVLDRANAA